MREQTNTTHHKYEQCVPGYCISCGSQTQATELALNVTSYQMQGVPEGRAVQVSDADVFYSWTKKFPLILIRGCNVRAGYNFSHTLSVLVSFILLSCILQSDVNERQ